MKRYFYCLAVLAIALGCSKPAELSSEQHEQRRTNNRWVSDHTHAYGPHDGTIVNWDGDKYFLELVVDHDNNEAIVYILGKDEKSPVASSAKSMELSILNPPMQVILKPTPQNGDPTGMSSRFGGKHDKLRTFQEFEGKLSGSVDNVPFSRDFVEIAHRDHRSSID